MNGVRPDQSNAGVQNPGSQTNHQHRLHSFPDALTGAGGLVFTRVTTTEDDESHAFGASGETRVDFAGSSKQEVSGLIIDPSGFCLVAYGAVELPSWMMMFNARVVMPMMK
jgi:hypothetical protein